MRQSGRSSRIVRSGVTTLSAALILAGSGSPLAAQTIADELRGRIELMRTTGRLSLGAVRVGSSEMLAAVYERRQYAPLWAEPGRRAALRVALTGLREDGLDPAEYHLPSLAAAGQLPAAAWTAELDLLHSHALLLAGLHLRFGRLEPHTLVVRTLADGLPPGRDPVILALALAGAEPSLALGEMRPQHFAYAGLARALRQLRQVERSGGWATPAAPMRLDSSGPDVLLLRSRLVATGDLPPDADVSSPLFDAVLEAAVRSFQHRHALNADGVVGPATLRELAVPLADRIEQVRINLERARWVLHDLPETFVAVNVAGALAYVVRHGEVVFETRVIVGREATRTPSFTATLRYIELNPTWTVPPGIVGEVLAAVRRDAGYLERNRIRVLDAAGRVVPASGIDFSRYTARTFPWVFRQEPGPLNPLGGIKFMFPNQFNVYLHDTPARQLFEQEQRTFSHGCVRVENPLMLAERILEDGAWTVATIDAAVRTGRTRTIALATPLPVVIQYWTAAADMHGELHFYRDVYGRDPPLQRAFRPD